MKRIHRYAVVLSASVFLLAGGCGDDGSSSDGARGTEAPSRVTGLIVSLEETGGEISSFVVRDEATEEEYEILIDPEFDYGFNLNHLIEHEEGELPVEVGLESRDGKLYATEILDA